MRTFDMLFYWELFVCKIFFSQTPGLSVIYEATLFSLVGMVHIKICTIESENWIVALNRSTIHAKFDCLVGEYNRCDTECYRLSLSCENLCSLLLPYRIKTNHGADKCALIVVWVIGNLGRLHSKISFFHKPYPP